MTERDVNKRLGEIRAAAWDYERARSLEDALFVDVLMAIACGQCEDPQAVAVAALDSRQIEFMRVTA